MRRWAALIVTLGLVLGATFMAGCGGDDGDGGGGERSWTGRWQSSFGELSVRQSGNKATGSYEYCGGRLRGTVSGSRLSGTWSEDPAKCTAGQQRGAFTERTGPFTFVLSEDGDSFDGHWRYAGGEKDPAGHDWQGTRVSNTP